jgi:hypothetical protein
MNPQLVNHRVTGSDSFAKYSAGFLRCPVPSLLQPVPALFHMIPAPIQLAAFVIYINRLTGLFQVMINDLLLLISLLQYKTLLNIFALEFFPLKHLRPSILLDFGVR